MALNQSNSFPCFMLFYTVFHGIVNECIMGMGRVVHPYPGNLDALMCLFNQGDIAFVRHTALVELQMRDPSFPIDQFQL